MRTDEVYRGPYCQQFGRGENSRFLEGLVWPNEVTMDELEAEYRAAAEDPVAEKEALDWLEANVDEALD